MGGGLSNVGFLFRAKRLPLVGEAYCHGVTPSWPATRVLWAGLAQFAARQMRNSNQDSAVSQHTLRVASEVRICARTAHACAHAHMRWGAVAGCACSSLTGTVCLFIRLLSFCCCWQAVAAAEQELEQYQRGHEEQAQSIVAMNEQLEAEAARLHKSLDWARRQHLVSATLSDSPRAHHRHHSHPARAAGLARLPPAGPAATATTTRLGLAK